GDNSNGQIGDNTTTNRSLITPAFYISGVKAVSCGYYHTLALDSTGTVWAWGHNSFGQLGTGDTTNRYTPVAVLSGVKAISAGGFFSLALRSDGTVWAWGDNSSGQLGTGDFNNRFSPTPMNGSFNYRIKSISAGTYHSLILNDGNLLY